MHHNIPLGIVSPATAAYLIEQSLLFDGASYLSRTPSTAGNRKTWTFSCWLKRGELGVSDTVFSAGDGGLNYSRINFQADNTLIIVAYTGGSAVYNYQTSAVFRDTSAWYHIVVQQDVAAGAVALWVNGVSVALNELTQKPINYDGYINNTFAHSIGRLSAAAAIYSGLMALPILVDGAALDPTSFGEEDDDGYWNPIDFTGASTIDFIDGYSQSLSDDQYVMRGSGGTVYEGVGQAFTLDEASTIYGAEVYLSQGLSPTGNATIGLYAVSGSVGSTAVPTGSLLASYTVDVTTLSARAGSGNNDAIFMPFGTPYSASAGGYAVTVEFVLAGASNYLSVEKDSTSPTHDGNAVQKTSGGSWAASTSAAMPFQVYAETTASFGTNGFQLDYADTAFYGKDISGGLTTAEKFDTSGLTYIGDMTAHSALSTAFDGDLFESGVSGVAKASSPGFVGVDWGSGVTKTVKGVIVYSYSDKGFKESTNPSVTVTLYGSASSPASATDGTSLGSTTFTDGSGTTVAQIFNDDVTSTTGYRYHWVSVNTAADCHVSEVVFLGNASGDVPANSYLGQNFTAADQLSDTPTDSADDEIGNWMTMSPINTNTNVTFSEGNMRLVGSGGDKRTSISSMILPSTGKFYFEAYWNSYAGDSGIGFMDTNVMHTSTWRTDANGSPGGTQNTDGYAANDGPNYYVDGGGAVSLTSPATTNYQQLAIDMDTGEVWYGINNTWLNSGNPAAGTGEVGTFDAANLANGLFFITSLRSGADVTLNFGQRAFNYTPPTGFTGLSQTANYSTPTIADPSAYFETLLYTGDGSASKRTDIAFNTLSQPDFVWIKQRSSTQDHALHDSVRGVPEKLESNTAGAAVGGSGFGSDGFGPNGVGSELRIFTADAQYNASGATYVAWCWKAGGAAVSNTDGSITSSVSANPTSGFSIGTYTGTGSNGTLGHGLTAAPEFMIFKSRSVASQAWQVWHKNLSSGTQILYLERTDGTTTNSTAWNSTVPTSSVISIGTEGSHNTASSTNVFYAWHGVEGFSKFGSYRGNGSTDGPFIFTGFRCGLFIIKCTSTTGGWYMVDSRRNPYNPVVTRLFANTTAVDADDALGMDFTANGVKFRNNSSAFNTASATYIFAAYAENPFQGGTADSRSQGRAR